ncbi:hypothetical protein FOZ60_000999 [Perkinsus olseni]|uniref:Uncharacterized protein n=1 Tax=Perkinsus olseni TaxID=32597 RepID=A0A7J6P2E1_PEROL|nr:hypothetical protein FOZ60_000999 [Perkinsus olseni]
MHPSFIVTVCILSVSHSLTRGLKILGRRYVGTIETSDNDKKITAELAFADTGNKVNMKFWSGAYGMKPAQMAAVFNRKLGNVVKAEKGNFQWLYYGPSGPNRKADYIKMMIGGQLVKLRLIDQ